MDILFLWSLNLAGNILPGEHRMCNYTNEMKEVEMRLRREKEVVNDHQHIRA